MIKDAVSSSTVYAVPSRLPSLLVVAVSGDRIAYQSPWLLSASREAKILLALVLLYLPI